MADIKKYKLKPITFDPGFEWSIVKFNIKEKKMKKYRFTLPVYGSQDISVEADNFEEAVKKLFNKESDIESSELDWENEVYECEGNIGDMADYCNNSDEE